MKQLRNERGYTLIEVISTLAISMIIFSVITLALHTLSSEMETARQDEDADRQIAKATAVLDRILTNTTEMRAVSNDQTNLKLYEKNNDGTFVSVYKAFLYSNGSLLVCPVTSIEEALTAPCSAPSIITDRLSSRPEYKSTVFSSAGARSSITLSPSGAAGTVNVLDHSQLVDVSLAFTFPTGVGSDTKNRTVSVQYKLWSD